MLENESRDNIIRSKTFNFSLRTLELNKIMVSKNEFVISNQLLRSATSIGANIEEAVAAHSKKDFLYKMVIALKEARETQYWFRLINKSNVFNFEVEHLIKEIEEIVLILTSIVKTTKERFNN